MRVVASRQEPRLSRGSDTPLWAQLLRDLRARLAAGEFTDSFPGEFALVGEYGVSRHTVREALRRLRAEGTVIAEHCGLRLTGGREQVRAVLPLRGERVLLSVPAGVALLAVERVGCLDGRPFEYRHTLVRGGRFAVTAQFNGRDVQMSAGAPGHLADVPDIERSVR